MDLKNMTEPTTTTGAALLLTKAITVLLPIGASLIAFWLGIRFVPIRKEHVYDDMINRVIACLISSFVIGITVLVLLYNHYPSVFDASRQLAVLAGLPEIAGFFTFTGCILIVCATPGPWVVAAAFLWLEKRKGKDIGELLNDLKHDIKQDGSTTTTTTSTPCENCANSSERERNE